MTVWLMIMLMVLKLTVSVLAAPNGGDIRKQFSYFESDRKMLVRIVFFFWILHISGFILCEDVVALCKNK